MTWSIPAAVWAEMPPDPQKQQELISGALPIAGLFLLVLAIAILLLWLSMRRQMTKIDSNLPAGADDREQALDRRLTEEAVERGEQEAAESPAPRDESPSGSSGS